MNRALESPHADFSSIECGRRAPGADRAGGFGYLRFRRGVLFQVNESMRPTAGDEVPGSGWVPSHHLPAHRALVIACVAAREKKKAPDPCELRALLRDEPSSPCTRHGRLRITGHRRNLRSDNASYARALDRAHNLIHLRDEIGIASDHFKGRVGRPRYRNPSPLRTVRATFTAHGSRITRASYREAGFTTSKPRL
jgi:hypothetical protein